MRTRAECEYRLMLIARDRNRDGRTAYVLEHEVVLCEDNVCAMVYLYFGLPGDAPARSMCPMLSASGTTLMRRFPKPTSMRAVLQPLSRASWNQ
jgi:hypothetical protein